VQVDATADQCRQLVLQIDEGKPRHMTVLEFHEDVDVAIGAEVVSQHGTEERKPPDVMPSAKIGDALAIDGELVWHLTHANADDRVREARPGETGSASRMISGRRFAQLTSLSIGVVSSVASNDSAAGLSDLSLQRPSSCTTRFTCRLGVR
jgi:hypothetical protein